MIQSHWRLINTWLKARWRLDWGLAHPQCFEGFHTLGHGVSSRRSSLIISPAVSYGSWHAVDQRGLKWFWCVCPIVVFASHESCFNSASTSAMILLTGWVRYSKLHGSLKALIGTASSFHSKRWLLTGSKNVFFMPFSKVSLLPWLYHYQWKQRLSVLPNTVIWWRTLLERQDYSVHREVKDLQTSVFQH